MVAAISARSDAGVDPVVASHPMHGVYQGHSPSAPALGSPTCLATATSAALAALARARSPPPASAAAGRRVRGRWHLCAECDTGRQARPREPPGPAACPAAGTGLSRRANGRGRARPGRGPNPRISSWPPICN